MKKQHCSTNEIERQKLTGDLIKILSQRQLALKQEQKGLVLILKQEIIKISSNLVAEEILETANANNRNWFWAGYQHRNDEVKAYTKAWNEFASQESHIGF